MQVWDRTASRGRVRINWPTRRHMESWRLSVEEFAVKDPDLADLHIERRPSLIPGAGHGVYYNY